MRDSGVTTNVTWELRRRRWHGAVSTSWTLKSPLSGFVQGSRQSRQPLFGRIVNAKSTQSNGPMRRAPLAFQSLASPGPGPGGQGRDPKSNIQHPMAGMRLRPRAVAPLSLRPRMEITLTLASTLECGACRTKYTRPLSVLSLSLVPSNGQLNSALHLHAARKNGKTFGIKNPGSRLVPGFANSRAKRWGQRRVWVPKYGY